MQVGDIDKQALLSISLLSLHYRPIIQEKRERRTLRSSSKYYLEVPSAGKDRKTCFQFHSTNYVEQLTDQYSPTRRHISQHINF